MDARRADEGFARLYADVYQLRLATVTPLRPSRRTTRRHLRLVVTKESGGGRREPR
jgi:hypothetical protein